MWIFLCKVFLSSKEWAYMYVLQRLNLPQSMKKHKIFISFWPYIKSQKSLVDFFKILASLKKCKTSSTQIDGNEMKKTETDSDAMTQQEMNQPMKGFRSWMARTNQRLDKDVTKMWRTSLVRSGLGETVWRIYEKVLLSVSGL